MSDKLRTRFLSTSLIIGFFLMWELLCIVLNVSDLVLPRPSEIAVTLWTRFPVLWPHILQTLYSTLFGFKASLSGKVNCYDNAAVETFFKTIKAELIWRRSWETRRQAEIAIFEYLNGFYNPRRRHSALGWKSPVAFERKVAYTSTWGGTKT